MELDVVEHVEKIASKIKVSDKKKRLEIAKEVNELAKILIEWYRLSDEKSNTIH